MNETRRVPRRRSEFESDSESRGTEAPIIMNPSTFRGSFRPAAPPASAPPAPAPPAMAFAFAAATAIALALGAGCDAEPPAPVMPTVEPPRAPEAVASDALPNVRFADVTTEAGIDFVHVNGMSGRKLLPETMGSGVAALDYDGDGLTDLFFVNSTHWPGERPEGQPVATQRLYRNVGGRFADVTAEAGLDFECFGQGVAVGDYDNDGDPDLYVAALGGGRLFRNDGGRFVDVTEEAGVGGSGWLSAPGFFDYDNDGDLDLFVCRYLNWSESSDLSQNFQLAGTGRGRAFGPPTAFPGTVSLLFRNDGNGRFVDVSEAAGIQIRTPDRGEPFGKSLGLAPWDVDGDGFVDLAVANDTVPNFLFRNLGNGTFEEIGTLSGIAFDAQGRARGAMGIDWGDFRNDGSLALAIGNFANEMTALYVADDPESFTFSDLANLFGLGAPTQPPLKFGLFFFDYDLDGRLDIHTTNGHLENDITLVQKSETYAQSAQLFWNSGEPGPRLFTLVGPETAGPDLFKPIVGRGSAYLDIDGDGDLDVVATANGGPPLLCRNDGGNANNWLRVKLRGTRSNRDGIGAKLELVVGDQTQRRQHFLARGYYSSMEPVVTFGIGRADRIDALVVRWPSGTETRLENLEPNRVVLIDEDAGLVETPAPGAGASGDSKAGASGG